MAALAVFAWALGAASCSLVGYSEVDRLAKYVGTDGGPRDGGEQSAGEDAGVSDARTAADASEDATVDLDARFDMDAQWTDAAADASDPLDGEAMDAEIDADVDAAGDGALQDADMIAMMPPTVIDDGGAPQSDAGPPTPNDAGAPVHDGGTTNPLCGGASALGVCWYLGAFGASCQETCANHGGFDPRTISLVGTGSQGGSYNNCKTVLYAIGFTYAPWPAFLIDGYSNGCNMFYTNATYWLDNPTPDFTQYRSSPYARIACGCKQ